MLLVPARCQDKDDNRTRQHNICVDNAIMKQCKKLRIVLIHHLFFYHLFCAPYVVYI
jgi:hypothetical protein